MPDIDITKIITASGGKIWDEFSEFLKEKSLISQGEQKYAYEQHLKNTQALKEAAAEVEADVDKYRARRLASLRIRSEGER